MTPTHNIPVVCVVGLSGAGKTTFIEKLIPEMIARGIRVGTLKHDVHGFDMDRPGKDSWRHKQAGAAVTVISSPSKIGMVKDTDHDQAVEALLPLFEGVVDLVLTEGYKRENRPKLEIFRSAVHAEPLCMSDENLIGLVSDAAVDLDIPRFSLDDVAGVADLLERSLGLKRRTSPAGNGCPAPAPTGPDRKGVPAAGSGNRRGK